MWKKPKPISRKWYKKSPLCVEHGGLFVCGGLFQQGSFPFGGFEANQNLTLWQINNTKGIFAVEE